MNKTKKILFIAFSLLFIMFSVILGYGIYLTIRVAQVLDEGYVETSVESIRDSWDFNFGVEPSTVLLMGIDALDMENELAFSDAIMLMSINPIENSVKLVNLNRHLIFHNDTENFHRFDRLAYYYVFGGPSLLMSTIQDALTMPVDRFIAVDFTAFSNIIDVLGGVEVYNMGDAFGFTSGYEGLDEARRDVWFESGSLHLNGMEAIEYARQRGHNPVHGENERQGRQQQIVTAVLNSLTDDLISQHREILTAIEGHFSHSLSSLDILNLFTPFIGGINEISHYSLNGTRYIVDDEDGLHEFRIVTQDELLEITNLLRGHLELPLINE